jgi:protein-tyrosine phosphatase
MVLEVEVTRTSKSTIRLSWNPDDTNGDMKIYICNSPGKMNYGAPISTMGKSTIDISNLVETQRYYFWIDPPLPENGILVAEREIHLEGAVNCRDLGGYTTEDGRSVKWGQIYRSAELSSLTERDLELLKTLNLRLICDFRTPKEVFEQPDILPGRNVSYYNAAVGQDTYSADNAEAFLQGDTSWFDNGGMDKIYIGFVEQYAQQWGTIINKMVHQNGLPILFHCMAGKDRTGAFAAILLLLIGIPEETIWAEHHLTNQNLSAIRLHAEKRIKKLGYRPDMTLPNYPASVDSLKGMIKHINTEFGSLETFLTQKAGVSLDTINTLRDCLLE